MTAIFNAISAGLNIDANNCQVDLLELYKQTRFDRSLSVQLTPSIERQLRDELCEEWLQKQILDRINNTQLLTSEPVPQFSPHSNSQRAETAISSDRDPNSEPTGMLYPTSSIFSPAEITLEFEFLG